MEIALSVEANKILIAVAEWVEQYDCIARIFLFGSIARGDARPDSDIDLLIEFKAKDLSELAEHLDSYCAFQNNCDPWAKANGELWGRAIHVHDAVFVDPPDAARPAVFAAAERPLLKIGKALAVWTLPKNAI